MLLLWVCQNFQAVASVNFYRTNTVSLLGGSYYCTETEYHRSPRIGKLYHYTHHLAQEVHISLDKPGVFYGDVLTALSKVPCDNCTFSQARKLKFIFNVLQGNGRKPYGAPVGQPQLQQSEKLWRQQIESETSHVMANIGAFIERIKQMAPVVREIEVECGENDFDQYPKAAQLLVDDVSNLVQIDIESESINPITQLARQSALSLQSLIIETSGGGDVIGFIKDADGNYTEYPQLRVLKLKRYSKAYWGEKPSFPGAMPFPRLRILKLDNYPFGDDVVFRGNAAMLECLEMEADSKAIKMFMELGLFTPASHPKLQYVKFEREGERGLYPFTTDTELFQILLSVGPSAAVRGLACLDSQSKVSTALSLLGNYPNVQVLCLPSTRLSLWNAITIIKSLPLLSDLHCESLALDPLPGKVIEDELPAYIVSNYLRMGERFRCCHVYCKSGKLIKEVATCVLLLALICPNFDHCDPPMDCFYKLMDRLKETIDLDGFKDHLPCLRRLLFTDQADDWQNVDYLLVEIYK
ncbi:hypothetical protein GGH94_002502 [Coemansia aciculifera]|uniref:Uncharacterized protein n=1 Tax=Coemansia aciculifera TaxID=417176 RepID=A0A9W8M3Y6_9FUNG|nr:hypothetical protein GGH94_002502 [Coemansia aciculifera]KAJ2874772.1 hypothetical protein GGH93_002131 [Coemansia aciculifera]